MLAYSMCSLGGFFETIDRNTAHMEFVLCPFSLQVVCHGYLLCSLWVLTLVGHTHAWKPGMQTQDVQGGKKQSSGGSVLSCCDVLTLTVRPRERPLILKSRNFSVVSNTGFVGPLGTEAAG